jgi:uncharacterized membrane protein
MVVPVVRVRKVPMGVCLRLVQVQMAMFGAGNHRSIVLMLVVSVMDVFMIVPQLFEGMFVLMTLGQMQPGAQRHQGTGDE